MNLDLYKHIYLIGVGGIGMSALARYFNSKGKMVSGYDKVKSELCIELETEGINIHYSDDVHEIPEPIKNAGFNDILVIYTPAISSENKVLSFFTNKGFKVYKRAEVLGMISKQSFTIAVAGTHGKTTTSTILAHILKQAGKDSTAFLGGISRNYNTNLLLADKGNILIVEADEYDRSFLQLHADIAIITSVDADHLDVYENKEDLEKAFVQFATQIKQKGLLLVEESVSIDFPVPEDGAKLTYSATKNADYYAENIKVKDGKMNFDLKALDIMPGMSYEQKQEGLEFILPGIHNVSNSIAASAVSCYLGLGCKDIASGLATFKGINRRFDVHLSTSKIAYVDDYAHHPEEVSATIGAAKQLFPQRDLTVVFQPHLFSRTQDFANEFASSLVGANDLILLDIYPAREKPITGVDSQMLLDLCTNPIKEVCSKEELLAVLKNKELDVLLTLGAGDIGTLVEPIKHLLN
ncbi:MAG: UDP-N-acetylmuramate--L-alanine ligase [Flavobacteriales bacterium]|jgi:UDP-N-acetylmuramate--alanine ligase|nr:UDP-N-acetylmuramate--L-alanine ligase [Flavobacteriales bacterium]